MQAAARSTLLVPLLLALPFTAAGVERTRAGADLVVVEYEGTISEVFDASEPYAPRGCVAQAWSVAEVLRSFVKLQHLDKE